MYHTHPWCPGGQKWALNPRTEAAEVVSTMEVLGTKPGSSVRAASAFCPFAITQAPRVLSHRYAVNEGCQICSQPLVFSLMPYWRGYFLLFILNLLLYVPEVLDMKCSMK